MNQELIVDQLERTGLSVCPDFLLPMDLNETRADLLSIQTAGKMHRGGTGSGTEHQTQNSQRHDEIHWLGRETANPVQTLLLEKFDLLKKAFNRQLYLGLDEFEGHYSIYPIGGFYGRHLDASKNGGSRMISTVLYLNKDWKTADGGELRVYQKDGSHINIQPTGGTLVCFMSEESEHEVMSSSRPRSSFVGWYRQKSPSSHE